MTDVDRLYYRYRIEGMDCASCAQAIEKELRKQGALEVSLNYALESLLVAIPVDTQPERFVSAIEKIGYRLVPVTSHLSPPSPAEPPPIIPFIAALTVTIPLWAGMLLPSSLLHHPLLYTSLAAIAWTIGVSQMGSAAIRSAVSGYPTMETLIVVGATMSLLASIGADLSGSAMGHHLSETAASIITFSLLGQILEKRALARTGSAMQALARLAPENALLVHGIGAGAETERVPFDSLKPGDRILVNAGETIPGDGTIYWGKGIADESLITGESELVSKEKGNPAIAGTLLSSGSLKIRLTRVGDQSTLGQIITLLADSQLHRPPIQRIGDTVGGIFVPLVCVLAIGTVIFSWITGIPFIEALLRGIAVLAASCPCAVGLATPTAVSVALGRAARYGVLIKGGEILEALASVKQVGFDKTGTITTGEFAVTAIHSLIDNENELRSIIRSLESHSTHPIARSLASACADAPLIELSSVEDRRSEGIRAVSASGDTLELHPTPIEHDPTNAGFKIIIVRNGETIGTVTIEDSLHFDARAVISALEQRGIATFLLSGDTTNRVKRVAQAIGVSSFYAECSPPQKREEIRSRRAHSPVAFVGDGVNDSLALSEATVGIAVHGGAETAMKSGDIILMGSQLKLVPSLLELGTATYRTIIWNFVWAFGYNLVAIPLAMGGILSPSYGALAMAFSDLVVVGNSLLLARRQLPSKELA